MRLGRQVAVRRWMKTMPKPGQGGVWNLPEDEVEVLVASLNDHRLRRAGEFDLGEGDLEVRAMERAKGDKRLGIRT